MLDVKNLTVSFGSFTAINDISFSLSEGQWLMLAGPNGSGKTTLLRAVTKSVPSEGRIFIGGKDIRHFSSTELARTIGVLSQRNVVSWAFTVRELVSLGRYSHRKNFVSHHDSEAEAVENALHITGLTNLADTNVQLLSGGELQRAFLAQVIAQDPAILILDEPANHLDIAYQRSIFTLIENWLGKPGRAVLSTVHDLPLARRFATDAILLKQGKVIAYGKPDSVFSDNNLNYAFDTNVREWLLSLYSPWGSTKQKNP